MAGSDFLDTVKGVTAEFEKQAELRSQIAAAVTASGTKDEATAKAITSEVMRRVAAEEKAAAASQKKAQASAQAAAAEKEAATAADKHTSAIKDQGAAASKTSSSITGMVGAWGAVAGAAGTVIGVIRSVDSAVKQVIDSVFEIEKELGVAGAKMAVLQSSKREVQGTAFKKLGGDYDATVKMALKLGINEDEAIADAKKLLNAGFSKSEIPVLMRIKAGMDVEGLDGSALFKKLESLKLGSKIGSKDIEGLKKLGVDTKAVYAEIAKKMGTDVPTAMAKVKKGAVDSKVAVEAIETATTKQFGGMADIVGNSVPALLARLKGDFEHLFDGVSMDPIKKVLHNILAEIEGGGGAKLKAGINDIFASAGVALGGLQSKGGVAHIFDEMAAAAHRAAAAIRALKPTVDALLSVLKALDKSGAAKNAIETAKKVAQAKAQEAAYEADLAAAKARIGAGKGSVLDYTKVATDPFKMDFEKRRLGKEMLDEASKKGPANDNGAAATAANDNGAASSDAANAAMQDGSADAGAALPNGMADGIRANESAAITAAEEMAENALAAAKAKLGVASPSKEFGKVGANNAEGMAGGMEDHPGPARAGAAMASSALAGASGGASPAAMMAGGAGGGAGGGSHSVSITLKVEGGGGGGGGASSKPFTPEQMVIVERAVRAGVRDAMTGARAA
jgi:hypothetical protein